LGWLLPCAGPALDPPLFRGYFSLWGRGVSSCPAANAPPPAGADGPRPDKTHESWEERSPAALVGNEPHDKPARPGAKQLKWS
jgi:hypothetical protein